MSDAGDDGDDEDLDWQIAELRRLLAEASETGPAADPEEVIELRAFLGLALSDRFLAARGQLGPGDTAGIEAARADRDDAVTQLLPVLQALDPGDPRRLDVADVLGRMRHDRYDDPWPGAPAPDPADLDAAIGLLTQVAAGEPDARAIWYLVLALADQVDLRSAEADRDALITWGLWLLDHPDTTGEAAADLHDLIGATLLDRAEESPHRRRPDLDAAIAHLETALAATPPEAVGRARLLALLTQACWLRLDGDASRYDEVDQMIGYATRAWQAQSAADEIPVLTGFYLAVGLQERLRRPGQPFEITEVNLAIEALERTEPLVADEPSIHLSVLVLLGLFLTGRGQHAGSTTDLAAAQAWLFQAADRLPADDPQYAELTQVLAVGMFVLASTGLAADHLERAIPLLAAAVENPGPDRAAVTRGALGIALISRAGFTQSGRDLDDGIAHLVAAYDLLATGDVNKIVIAHNLGSGLLTRFLRSGDLRDRDAARFYLKVMGEVSGPTVEAIREEVWAQDMTVTAMRGLISLADGLRGDQAALDEAVEQLRAALAMLPAGHPYQGRLRSDLGLALSLRAAAGRGGSADLAEATSELEAAASALPPGHIMRHLAVMRVGAARVATAYSARDPRLLREAIGYLTGVLVEVGSKPALRVRVLSVLGVAAEVLHRLTGDPADLDSAAAWLTEARQEYAAQPGDPEHANCLSRLAQVYRTRGDKAAAREAGLAALRARGREVLLQTGTARGLGVARRAAAEAAGVAAWCLADDHPAAAIDALELGRGLVLHSATSATGVPAMLAGAGRADLAAEWEAQAASLGDRGDPPWDAGVSGSDHAVRLLAGDAPLEVPSDLRARVLDALAGVAGEKLLAPPARVQIAAALARTGADALVYLLGPAGGVAGGPAGGAAGGQVGCAIVIPAGVLAVGARPQVLPLPALSGPADPIGDYAAAYGEVLAAPGEPQVIGRWRRSLETLCSWAWPAVMGPLLGHVGDWGLHRPPRLVLIPAGRLNLVPWHAAFEQPPGAAARRHACAAAVISYAASGRQLIQVSRRPALDLQAAPVIVGNPTFDLPFAGLEAQAIRDRCYPAGRYFGYAGLPDEITPDGPGLPDEITPDGPGLPGEVLGLLPTASQAGASMVHLGCHADVVGSAPGQSYLLLAGERKLMIEAILRRASGRPAQAPGGLVSLAACRSDLAAGEYDEALTLATAFLAAGAVTVVGARWEVPDRATSLLMFMFHHFMTSSAASPRDALRLAQLWMLDPGRAAPPEMPAHLASHASRRDLADVVAWAALTHQGR